MLGSGTANQKNSFCVEKEFLTVKGETPFYLKPIVSATKYKYSSTYCLKRIS
jgi:hypothetical protein